MHNFIFLLALVSSVGSWAAYKINPIAQCGRDGGYLVSILSGGSIGYLRAEIFGSYGPSTNGTGTTVALEEINHLDGLEFRDFKTKGKVLRLTIDFNNEVGEKMYQGYLRGNLNGHVIPPTGAPEQGKLNCRVFTNK